LFSRPLAQWHEVGRSLLADPAGDKALLLTSVLVDHRAVWGGEARHDIATAFEPSRRPEGSERELLLHMMGRYALMQRPPTGFLRDFVVESGGARRGRLDLKHGGILPIVNLARWAGLRAGVLNASTTERLRAAGAAGTLSSSDTEILLEVYSVITEVRVSHQLAQWEAGQPADDFIRPAELSSITRAQLKETFRALAGVQRAVQAELTLGR
jgi:CBS domain-containing protein